MIGSPSFRADQQAVTAERGLKIIVSVAPRGGLTTKIYPFADGQGFPIRLSLTARQSHDRQADNERERIGELAQDRAANRAESRRI
ncbi:MAG: hypothetical protein IE934_13705 [Sphingopyxis sp.]|nr:hypothetical protein [Sphingopyxis sp.]